MPHLNPHALRLGSAEHKYLYRNLRNGRFEEVSDKVGLGILEVAPARGCAFGGVRSNRTGIGSRVTAMARTKPSAEKPLSQMDELRSGGSYFSQNDLRMHFGLDRATRVDKVEARWLEPLKAIDNQADACSHEGKRSWTAEQVVGTVRDRAFLVRIATNDRSATAKTLRGKARDCRGTGSRYPF